MQSNSKIPHIPVLLNEVLSSFDGIGSGYFIDCTLGYGGHSEAILNRHENIYHIGIDRDREALEFSKRRLDKFKNRSELHKGTFSDTLSKIQVVPIVGVLADFGVSSLQLDKLERGFSFNSEILDMRMDRDLPLSAYDVVNGYSQTKLEYIFKEYGELPQYRKLAKSIVEARAKKIIESSKELSEIISSTIRGGKIHPATLPFQAIRIEVNSELQEIERLLDILEHKGKNGELNGTVISIITFHSLEDRLVKRRFKRWSQSCICSSNAMRCECGKNHELGRMPFRKPKVASKREIKLNPRSRSAKLRSFIFKYVSK